MGLYVYMYIHQEDDLVIDIPGVNKAIMATTIAQDRFYDAARQPNWKGPFTIEGNEFLMASMDEGQFDHYSTATNDARGIFEDPKIWDIFASFVEEGKVVFRLETEGHPDQYIVVTPNKVDRPKLTF